MSKINYNLSLIKGIAFDVDGVLSPSTCPLSTSGHPIRQGNVKDGYALQLAIKKGIKIAVITGGESIEIANRMKLLGIKDLWQNTSNKSVVLKQWMDTHGFRSDEICYMGDDIPDLKCLRIVGLPCCPHDASWEVKKESKYISPLAGGYGAARDIIQQIMTAQGLWDPESSDALIW